MEGKERLHVVFCCLWGGRLKAEGHGTHKGQGGQGPKEAGNDHTKHKQLPALGPDVGELIQHTGDHCLQACKLRHAHRWSQGGFGTNLLPPRTANRRERQDCRVTTSPYSSALPGSIFFCLHSDLEPIAKDMKERKYSIWTGLFM